MQSISIVRSRERAQEIARVLGALGVQASVHPSAIPSELPRRVMRGPWWSRWLSTVLRALTGAGVDEVDADEEPARDYVLVVRAQGTHAWQQAMHALRNAGLADEIAYG